jgi:Ca-activated chloride channel family protein
LALVVLAPLPSAHAFEWQDLWQRPDQRGSKAFESEQPERAAQLFENPEWRSAAQYRAGQFEDSAASLSSVDSTEGHYNRGNALAKAAQLPAAIAEYDRALELDPDHEDARYNRDLLKQYLEDHPEQQPPQEGQQGDSEQSQSQSGEQQDGQGGDEQQGEQGESGDSQDAAGANDQPTEPDEGEPQGEENQQDANAGEQPADQATESAAGPEEVEQWASQQAAEQWLRRVPQDPGGLLRRKFLYQYQRFGVDQAGNRAGGTPAERRQW